MCKDKWRLCGRLGRGNSSLHAPFNFQPAVLFLLPTLPQLIPRRLDWQGKEHRRSFEDLVSKGWLSNFKWCVHACIFISPKEQADPGSLFSSFPQREADMDNTGEAIAEAHCSQLWGDLWLIFSLNHFRKGVYCAGTGRVI